MGVKFASKERHQPTTGRKLQGCSHRMRGEKCQIVGDCALDPLGLHVGVMMLPAG
jgi:hypothetical protein